MKNLSQSVIAVGIIDFLEAPPRETEGLSMADSLRDDLGLDELEIIDLCMTVEELCDVLFDEREIQNFSTVQDIVTCIKFKTA